MIEKTKKIKGFLSCSTAAKLFDHHPPRKASTTGKTFGQVRQ